MNDVLPAEYRPVFRSGLQLAGDKGKTDEDGNVETEKAHNEADTDHDGSVETQQQQENSNRKQMFFCVCSLYFFE